MQNLTPTKYSMAVHISLEKYKPSKGYTTLPGLGNLIETTSVKRLISKQALIAN